MTESTSQEEGKRALLEGIGADAASEAAAIVKQAEEEAAQRMRSARGQAAAILEEGRQKAEAVVRNIERQAEQTAAVEIRRIGLRVREQASRRVLDEVTARLERMMDRPDYREVLKGWIVEGALGLFAQEVTVLASEKEMEMIDRRLLDEAAAEVRRSSGLVVSLHLSADKPGSRQGVVLTSVDGRTAFNNQVPTRMERYQGEIRKLIYDSLRRTGM